MSTVYDPGNKFSTTNPVAPLLQFAVISPSLSLTSIVSEPAKPSQYASACSIDEITISHTLSTMIVILSSEETNSPSLAVKVSVLELSVSWSRALELLTVIVPILSIAKASSSLPEIIVHSNPTLEPLLLIKSDHLISSSLVIVLVPYSPIELLHSITRVPSLVETPDIS